MELAQLRSTSGRHEMSLHHEVVWSSRASGSTITRRRMRKVKHASSADLLEWSFTHVRRDDLFSVTPPLCTARLILSRGVSTLRDD